MGNLILSDIKRLMRCRTLWVCSIIGFLFGMLMTVMYHMSWENMSNSSTFQMVMMYMGSMGMDSDTIKQAMSQIPSPIFWRYINAFLSDGTIIILSAVVISVYVGSEYTESTIKNTLSRGFSRVSVYLSKYITALISMAVTALAYVAGGGIVAAILFDLTTDVSDQQMIITVLAYCCIYMAVTALYMMTAVVVRKVGISIALNIVFPNFVALLINALMFGFEWVSDLIKFLIFELVQILGTLYQNDEIYIAFIVSAVYLALSLTVGIVIFHRQEIK